MSVEFSKEELTERFNNGFVKMYASSSALLNDEKYNEIKELCFKAASDSDLLNNIIFCNDTFSIPPVKTFFIVYKNELAEIDSKLDSFPKREIGAFWGFIFKGILNYSSSKSVTVTFDKEIKVRVSTASYFIK